MAAVWTDAELATLCEMVAAGQSVVAIGARLRRTSRAVRLQATRQGLALEGAR